MPRLDPATRNIAIGRLHAGESKNEVARTLNVNPDNKRFFTIIVLPLYESFLLFQTCTQVVFDF